MAWALIWIWLGPLSCVSGRSPSRYSPLALEMISCETWTRAPWIGVPVDTILLFGSLMSRVPSVIRPDISARFTAMNDASDGVVTLQAMTCCLVAPQ